MQQDHTAIEGSRGGRRRRLFVVAAILTAILAAGYTGYWIWAAGRLTEGIASWRQEQQRRGYEIAYREPEVTGFPGAARAVFQDPRIAAPSGWRYRGPPLTARVDPWQPFRIALDLSGLHRFTETRSPPRTSEIKIDRGQSQILLNRTGGFDRVRVETLGLAVDFPKAAVSADRAIADFGPLRPGAADRLEALDFALELGGLVLPDGVDAAFGQEIERFQIDATLHGHLEPGNRPETLGAWRDAGGRFEIHRLVMTWGPLSAEARGNLSLDSEFRPRGKLKARFQGLDQTVDRLEQAGMIDPDQARTARSLLALLAKRTSEEEDPSVTLPVQFNRGRLFLGPLAIGRLSPVL